MPKYKPIVDTVEAIEVTEINRPFLEEKFDIPLTSSIGNYLIYEGDCIVNEIEGEEFDLSYTRQTNGILGSICKYCGKEYHACSSCDWWLDQWLWIAFKGFCSWECAEKTPLAKDLHDEYEKDREDQRREDEEDDI